MKTLNRAVTRRTRATNVPRWLVDTIARESWALNGRGATLDWVGVERHLGRVVEQAQRDAQSTDTARAAAIALGKRAVATRSVVQGARS